VVASNCQQPAGARRSWSSAGTSRTGCSCTDRRIAHATCWPKRRRLVSFPHAGHAAAARACADTCADRRRGPSRRGSRRRLARSLAAQASLVSNTASSRRTGNSTTPPRCLSSSNALVTSSSTHRQYEQHLVAETNGLIERIEDLGADLHVLWREPCPAGRRATDGRTHRLHRLAMNR
jgi:hypothetical protein